MVETVRAFLGLKESEKQWIAKDMNMIEPRDFMLPSRERWRNFLLCVQEQNRVNEFTKLVNQYGDMSDQ